MDNLEKLGTLGTQAQEENKQSKKQSNMCWTSPYTRHKTNTNKTKNTTQYLLDTTIHNTQDEDKQTKNTTQYVLDTSIKKSRD